MHNGYVKHSYVRPWCTFMEHVCHKWQRNLFLAIVDNLISYHPPHQKVNFISFNLYPRGYLMSFTLKMFTPFIILHIRKCMISLTPSPRECCMSSPLGMCNLPINSNHFLYIKLNNVKHCPMSTHNVWVLPWGRTLARLISGDLQGTLTNERFVHNRHILKSTSKSYMTTYLTCQLKCSLSKNTYQHKWT